MKITTTILTMSPEEAAANLYEAGLELKGHILPRSTWLEIAQALQVKRISEIVFQRLLTARTTKDAMRAVYLARKWKKTRKTARGRAAQTAGRMEQQASGDEFETSYDFDWDVDDFWDDLEPVETFYEWLRETRGLPSSLARYPGIVACSPIQERLTHFTDERRKTQIKYPQNIRSWLDDEQADRLAQIGQPYPPEQFTGTEKAFLRQNGLPGWKLSSLQDLSEPIERETSTIYTLAAALLLKDKGFPLQVSYNWEEITRGLLERLMQPASDDADVVIQAAYGWSSLAPKAEIRWLGQQAGKLHPDWLPVLFFLWQRRDDLFGSNYGPDPYSYPLINDRSVESMISVGFGSKLVLQNLKNCYAELLSEGFQIGGAEKKWTWWGLPTAGAGSIRRMNYPSFILTCRPGVNLVSLKTMAELVALVRAVDNIQTFLLQLNQEVLGQGFALAHQEIYSNPIQENLPALAAEAVLKYASAYLILKTGILKAEFELGPFRLRRKHIRRFWKEVDEGKWVEYSPQQDWATLVKTIPPDLVREALIQALLDQIHETLPVEQVEQTSLKQECIYLVRLIAMTFDYQPPWLPKDQQVQAEDLIHARELADYLLRRSVHAPLEMLQALGIPQAQGFPLLNGGQTTPLERSIRQTLRMASGVNPTSTPSPDGAPARIFVCKPISKLAALDRGNLGGDCSTTSVPFRALSPHHTYYGIFDGEIQQRGYMTVFEAWAQTASGKRIPVLCLETINVPIEAFDYVQQDLLVIFDAIARSRGLFPRVVLITGIGTWNYQNGEILRQSRRFRQGTPVLLTPADPICWDLYSYLSSDSQNYNSFGHESHRELFRILAPLQLKVDLLQPENLAEARRLANLPPGKLVVTVQVNERIDGFISEML